MPGSEMLKTVTSILMRKTGNRTTARAAQRALHDISIHRLKSLVYGSSISERVTVRPVGVGNIVVGVSRTTEEFSVTRRLGRSQIGAVDDAG